MEVILPEKTNISLAVGFSLIHLFQYFALPLFLLPDSLWWGVLLVPIALMTPSYWALMHEAVHGIFVRDHDGNDAAGRVLFILFGSPFYFLRFGHLTHHRYNRRPVDLDDACDPEADGCGVVRKAGYYFKLFGGTYLQELAVPLLFLLPKRLTVWMLETFMGSDEPSYVQVREHAVAQLVENARIRRVLRVDTLMVYLLFALAFFAYGASWWMLVLSLLMRGFLVSFLDNVYHYGTPTGDRRFALYLATPRWLQVVLLNFNFHYMHHRHPAMPWNRLGVMVNEDGRHPDMGYFEALARQLRGPVPSDRIPV